MPGCGVTETSYKDVLKTPFLNIRRFLKGADQMPGKRPTRRTQRYRVTLRLGPRDEALLRELERTVGHGSRTSLLTDALRHFYWSVVVKDQPVWLNLPRDTAASQQVETEPATGRKAVR